MPIKGQIHARLADIETQTTITVDEIIQAYGQDDRRKLPGYKQELSRADILAQCYGLKVTKEGDNYLFYKD